MSDVYYLCSKGNKFVKLYGNRQAGHRVKKLCCKMYNYRYRLLSLLFLNARTWSLSALHREIEISSPLVGPRDAA